MPKLTSKAPADVKKSFDQMYAELLKHEKNHGQSGILAGKEIEAKKCQNGDAILKKYNKRDKAYDKKTKHGFTEGVKL
jgi:predicted secreted Zn-dependent protease